MLGSLSNISTLLGLLGTISGMITVFQVISTQTVVDPPSLAGGISEALYTTAFGLLVAIPSFIGYKFKFRYQLLIGVGFCGSLTTFSSWMIDIFNLILHGSFVNTMLLIIFPLLIGICASTIGYWIGSKAQSVRP